MKFKQFSALLLIAISTGVLANEDSCKDAHSWCPHQPASFCKDPVMENLCKKSCGACLPAGCLKCEQRCDEKTLACLCRDGYKLMKNNKSCEDIDECSADVNPCSSPGKPKCHNFPGGFQCLESDEECQAKGETNYYMKDECCKQPSPTLTYGKCGLSALNVGKIVGGKNTTVERWPWMVYLELVSDICGGSILNARWIVTAAHCVSAFKNPSIIKITVGVTNIADKTETTRQIKKAKRVIIHEDYDFPYNDVALIELEKPLKWSKYVEPICLPNGNKPKIGEVCFATGYGRLSVGGPSAEVLQEVDLPIVNPKVCAEAFKDEYCIDSKSMVCGGYITGGKDACQGDSGGPYVCQRCDSCEFYLAGMTSFGDGCATPGRFGVYMNMEYFEEWIADKISAISVKKETCVKREWSRWGSWGSCSKTCRAATQSRFRFCLNGIAGQGNCIGDRKESRACNTHECTEVTWSAYKPWSDCSKTCGDGLQTRSRTCLGETKSSKCVGEASETQSCFVKLCDEWAPWQWGDCDKTCGGGKQMALRLCYVEAGCRGEAPATRPCNTQPCPAVGVSERISGGWSAWEPCSVTCGTGVQTRKNARTKKSERRDCKVVDCAKWAEWRPWSSCTKSCGEGTSERKRECLHRSKNNVCKGKNKATRSCNTHECPVPFEPWTSWSECTVECGKGTQTRTRKCPKNKTCFEKDVKNPSQKENKNCNTQPCARWGEWGKWDSCSSTCGKGSKTRMRKCLNGKVGSKGCTGEEKQTEQCKLPDCEKWKAWSKYGSCSKSCGKGTKTRSRECDGGTPGEGGCSGNAVEEILCNTQPCPSWSRWEKWSECSATCGKASSTRTRTCVNGVEGQAGCKGPPVEEKDCVVPNCEFWEKWGPYVGCSKSCGGGINKRYRTCNGGKAGDLGCLGSDQEEIICNTKTCPSWEPWGAWSECSQTCGFANRNRERKCLNGKAGDQGCDGDESSQEACNFVNCPETCSEQCRIMVENDYCITGDIYKHNCSPVCCECEDVEDNCAAYTPILGCSYECKRTCNLCYIIN